MEGEVELSQKKLPVSRLAEEEDSVEKMLQNNQRGKGGKDDRISGAWIDKKRSGKEEGRRKGKKTSTLPNRTPFTTTC